MNCRGCDKSLPDPFLDWGDMPLANAYLDSPDEAEAKYPVRLRVCHACWLVQLDPVVTPEQMFSDYAYFSGFSATWREHCSEFARTATKRLGLNHKSLVVEVASNDGTLLECFDVPVLGVEPAANVAAAAKVPTRVEFFGADTQVGPASLIVANNVLAHVPDLAGFLHGIAANLRPNGVATFEFPWLVSMLARVEFDTIYHEHSYYLSLTALAPLLADAGLRCYDVEEIPTHGGSLRLWCCPINSWSLPQSSLRRVAAMESWLKHPEMYDEFARCADEIVRTANLSGVGYGAAAKAVVFLNRSGPGDLAYVADASPHKQGRYLPGVHLPIVSPQRIIDDQPDMVVVLAWNLIDEVTVQLRAAGYRGEIVTCK